MAAWIRVNEGLKSTREYVNLDSGVYVLFTLAEEIDDPAPIRADQIPRASITSHAGDTRVTSASVAVLYQHILDHVLAPSQPAAQATAVEDQRAQVAAVGREEMDLITLEDFQTMSDAQLEALAQGRSITQEEFEALGRGKQPQPEECSET